MPGLRFPFAHDDPLLRPFSLAFGVTEDSALVELIDRQLLVRFGPWRLATPVRNIASVTLTGPYRLAKVVGPPRLSVRDRGITFATSRRRGACFSLHEPVPAVGPLGLLRHPGVTVTVADPEGLRDAVGRESPEG